MQFTYNVEGMHCNSCIDKIRTALQPVAMSVEVTLKPPVVKLTATQPVSIEELNKRVASVGKYQLFPGDEEKQQGFFTIYYPLLLIIAYITGIACINNFSGTEINWHGWMNTFMAGFFLVFSAFKFLDLSGFAEAYATYDLLAQRCRWYGFIYPFIELGLGIGYLAQIMPIATYLITIIMMGFSSLGVLKALLEKRKIRCACLGTVLNLPMTTITFVEDVAMVVMAAAMLIF